MIRVLHLGHSRKWRGGENQVKILIEGLTNRNPGIHNHIGYPDGAQMIEKLSCDVDGVLKFPSTRPFDPRSIISLVSYVKKNAIDIIDAHSGNTHSLAYYASHFLPQTKVNVHRHVDFPIKRQYMTRKKYLSEKIDQYVAISSAIKTRLVNYGIADNKICVIKSTIDATPYQNLKKHNAKSNWCEKYGLEKSLPLVGFAGVLEEKKDPALFIKTISVLKRRGIVVNALIAGSGPLQAELAQQIKQLQLTDSIRLTGFISDMPGFFAALDIFVLPSKQEGLGTVLLEAIHSRCVAVASNVGGITEIITDQETGMLGQAGNVDSFVNAIQKILAMPDLSDQLKNNAIRHVNKHFDSSKMIEANYRNYQKLATKI